MESRLSRLRIIARTMTAERVTLEVAARFEEIGLENVVLKGPVFAHWLFDDPAERGYTDSDFLVPSDEVERAEEILRSLGFAPNWDIRFEGKKPWTEHDWVRSSDDARVDLHRTLQGVGRSPEETWEILSRHRSALEVRGQVLHSLDEVANALHVVLHAAQHGRGSPKPQDELARALDRLPPDIWPRVGGLAGELLATEWLSSGLRFHPVGSEIADALNLSTHLSLETVLRRESAPFVAETLVWLDEMGSWRARFAYMGRSMFPPARSMRTTSELARKSVVGLVIAYPIRWWWVFRHLPRAVRAYRAARKATSGG